MGEKSRNVKKYELYSVKSRAFYQSETGKIAKVINRYGDEVLKVYEVR
jgi:hypothetical protein